MGFLFTVFDLFFPQYLQLPPCWIYTYDFTTCSSASLCISTPDRFCFILYFKWTFKTILQEVLFCWGTCTVKFYMFSHYEDNLKLVLSWRPVWSWEKQERTTARPLWGLNPIFVFSIGSYISVLINLQYSRKKTDAMVQIPALLKKALQQNRTVWDSNWPVVESLVQTQSMKLSKVKQKNPFRTLFN